MRQTTVAPPLSATLMERWFRFFEIYEGIPFFVEKVGEFGVEIKVKFMYIMDEQVYWCELALWRSPFWFSCGLCYKGIFFCGDKLVFSVMGKCLKLSAVKKFFRHLVWLWRLMWQSKPATIRNRFEPRGNICWKFKFRNVSRKQQSSLGLQSAIWSFSIRVC